MRIKQITVTFQIEYTDDSFTSGKVLFPKVKGKERKELFRSLFESLFGMIVEDSHKKNGLPHGMIKEIEIEIQQP